MQKTCIVISASSDIGTKLCQDWSNKSWRVLGTYRNETSEIKKLKEKPNVELFHCDLLQNESINKAIQNIINSISRWDNIVFCPGILKPIGNFQDIDFDEWEKSIQINFLKQLKILHLLLPHRNKIQSPTVLFFAGGGTNNAVLNYSSYTVSKIALIKMCELLDAEIPDVRFSILGPGWVKTKIHNETLEAGEKNADQNYFKTLEKIQNDKSVDINKVIECCSWIVTTKSKAINGRNLSVEFDKWGSVELEKELEKDNHMYKLRRYKNDW